MPGWLGHSRLLLLPLGSMVPLFTLVQFGHGKVPISDREALDRPGVRAEELVKQHGVVTTVGDLLPALQQRKLLASEEHLAAASRLAGAGDTISLQQCYAVHLTAEDSERLKMPFDRYVCAIESLSSSPSLLLFSLLRDEAARREP